MARLIFRDSQGREGTVELSANEIVYVGRGLECAIRTDDGMVSRRHAQFRNENGRFVVEDLGSANGTHLNNIRIQKQALGHTDVIQCGSLVIRFLDDGGVNVVPQPPPMGGPVPGKKGGTMVLDRGDGAGPGGGGGFAPGPGGFPPPGGGGGFAPAPGGFPPAAGGFPPAAPGGFGAPPAYGGPPAMPGGPPAMPGMAGPPAMPGAGYPGSGSSPGMPYGGPPSVAGAPGPNSMFGANRGGFGGSAAGAQSLGKPQAQPYGGPPAMPGGAPPAMPYGGPPAMPYGGPPAMPGGGPPATPGGGSPAMPGAGPSMYGRPGTRPDDAENKVLVDLGLAHDPQKTDGEIKALKADLEKANAAYEREVADGKRIRAEAATLRDKIEELRAAVKDREEQAAAHDRVADELRDELQQTRNELVKVRGEVGEMAENVAARERQAARAQEDSHKIREDMEDKNRQLMELSRTKDEGWKKLNEQLTEIDHLREVINEQERMLEERRVGLISQEEVIKELRGDKERTLKQIAALKAERDEAAMGASRSSAQLTAIEEENKRLGRMLVENQTEHARGGAQPDHMMRLTDELKDLRVEHKKLEADRERLTEQYQRAERDRERLEGRLAQVEVELQETLHAKIAAESARGVAADALAKAEVARHKAAEEALAAARARDQAASGGDDARRELDKLRKKVADLEKVAAAPVPAADLAELQRERESNERKLKELIARSEQAERSLRSLEAALEASKTDAQKARAEAARAKASADAQAESIIEAVGSPAGSPELAKRAREIYDAINDILSAMRNHLVLVQGELPNLTSDDHETLQAVTDAVEQLVDSAETAKGALRGLRDLGNL